MQGTGTLNRVIKRTVQEREEAFIGDCPKCGNSPKDCPESTGNPLMVAEEWDLA